MTNESPSRPGSDFTHCSPEWATSAGTMTKPLRDEDSLGFSEEFGGFHIASRYEDVCKIARDAMTFSSASGTTVPPLGVPMPPVTADPPVHLDYRKILNSFFAPARVGRYLDWTTEYVRNLANTLFAREKFELVHEFANELTRSLTFHVLGIPNERVTDEVSEWVDDFVFQRPGMAESAGKMSAFFLDEFAERRANPGDDVLTAVVQAEVQGRPLDDVELVGVGMLLMLAGLDTTNGAISGGTHYFMNHPEARAELIDADDRTWKLAMDEIVRWTSPASANGRLVTQDTEVRGCPMKSGDRLMLLWASANRDEREFFDPDEVVLDRSPNRHVGFGMGPHRCLGSHLAKQTLQVYFENVLPRLDGWKVSDEPDAVEWEGRESRGMTRLVLERVDATRNQ
ncbi:cytochrome P450 [Nocardia cyriacigeorgica]|uniref:cytochrome P450 n=1 Tax=Nocardia cyriacigeorgica TaxID=135487 RepID=UPI0013D6EB9A|nr:cytochrome P450 [Nocardia cyriacigeorgica]NEW27085.1 cytochrome P450 [Nocardia cyriacigeorgica]